MAKTKVTPVAGKNLGSEEDVQQATKMAEGQGSKRDFLSIPDKGRAPFYVLSPSFYDGYQHWIRVEGSKPTSVICTRNREGSGGDTDSKSGCQLCDLMFKWYEQAKNLREKEDEAQADVMKKKANGLQPKYAAHFLAIRGETMISKNKAGEKVYKADMDTDNDSVEIGVLSMSSSQFTGYTGLIDNEEYKFIKSGKDLTNRIIWSTRQKTEGNFQKVVWVPESITSDRPLDPDELDIDISHDFDTNPELVQKMADRLSKKSQVTEDDDDDAVETESSDVSSKKGVDFLEDDDETEVVAEGGEESEDVFEDDDPEEDAKEAAALKAKSKATVKKTSASSFKRRGRV